MKNITNLKNIVLLQGVIIIYSISSVMSKQASAHGGTILFLFFFGLEIVLLSVYAVLWQQMMKRFELSVAYANRSMAVVWSMIWAVVFFHNTITVKNMIGVLLIVAGTIIINIQDTKEEADD